MAWSCRWSRKLCFHPNPNPSFVTFRKTLFTKTGTMLQDQLDFVTFCKTRMAINKQGKSFKPLQEIFNDKCYGGGDGPLDS